MMSFATLLLQSLEIWSAEMSAALTAVRSKAQLHACWCANNYWLNLCNCIQNAAEIRDARMIYEGIKKATASKAATLKSKMGEVITNQGQQKERWVKHYLELYVTQDKLTSASLDAFLNLLVMELLDTLPTLEELSKPLTALLVGRTLVQWHSTWNPEGWENCTYSTLPQAPLPLLGENMSHKTWMTPIYSL